MKFKKTYTKDYKRFRYYIDNNSVNSELFYVWKYVCQLRCQLNKMTFETKENGITKSGRLFEIVVYRSN